MQGSAQLTESVTGFIRDVIVIRPSAALSPGATPDHGTTVVGLDCLALPRQFSGAAHYIVYLTRHLLGAPRPFAVKVFCKPYHAALFRDALGPGDAVVPVPLRHRAEQLWYYEYGLGARLKAEGVNLFWATHYLCPPPDPAYRLLTTVHDLGFVLHPRHYPVVKRLYFGRRMRTFLSRADAVVAVSSSTAADLGACFPELEGRIRVVTPGTDHFQERGCRTSDRPPAPLILAVNTLERRKNVPFLVRVFDALKAAGLPHRLVVVGQAANGSRAVRHALRQSPHRADIVLTGAVPEPRLRRYYREADLFLNASTYEGFGFTPFEAIRADVPALLYANNTVSEFLGDHPYIQRQLDARKWAELIAAEWRDGFPGRIPSTAVDHLSWANCTRAAIRLVNRTLESNPEEMPIAASTDSGNCSARASF